MVAAFLAMNSAASPPAAAAVAGGGGGSDTLIASFSLANFNSGAGSNRSRLVGHTFQLGDVPSGSALVLTDGSDVDIAHNVVHRRFDPDTGDLIFCHVVQRRASDIAASTSETTKLKARPGGSYVDTPSGLDMTDIVSALSAASKAATIAFTSVTATYSLEILLGAGLTNLSFPGFIKTGYSVTVATENGSPITSPANYTLTNGSGTTYQGQSGYDGLTFVRSSGAHGGVYIKLTLTWTHMSGTMRAAMSEADVSARTSITIDTPLLIAGNSWAMAKDAADGSGQADNHLRTTWFWWAYLDGAGTIEQLYVKPVTKLDWFDVANKTMLSYTAAFKMGTTTLDTYSSLVHAHLCWWAGVKNEDSLWAGRKHCLIGTTESVNAVLDKDYLIACENFPIFDPDLVPDELSAATYSALSTQGYISHIDAGGEHMERGRWPRADVHAFMLQTALAHRNSLVTAYAGHHVGYHCRPGSKDVDAPDKCLTLILNRAGVAGADDTWEADGMPTAVADYNRDSRGDLGAYTFPAQTSTGGFITSGDASHAGNYGIARWFYDGDEDFLQSQMDLTTNLVGQMAANNYGSKPALMFYENVAMRTAFSIPSSLWSAIICGQSGYTERAIGFALNIAADAYGWCPSDAPEFNFIHDFVEHQADYMATSVALWDANFLANGSLPMYRNDVQRPWQLFFVALGTEAFAQQTKMAGAISLANHMTRYVKNMIGTNPIKAIGYSSVCFYKTRVYDASTNLFADPEDMGIIVRTTTVASTNVLTLNPNTGGNDQPYMRLTNGDVMYVATLIDVTTGPPGDTSFISPFVEDTPYYVGSISDNDFKLYTDAGLTSEVNVAADGDQLFIWLPRAGDVDPYLDNDGNPTEPNEYQIFADYVACQMNKRDDSVMTNAIVDQMQNFNSLVNFVPDARWKAVRI